MKNIFILLLAIISSSCFQENKAGHAFIGISQGDITRVLGFYPTPNTIDPSSGIISSQSILRDNSNHSYDVSISTNIDSLKLNDIYNNIINFNSTYNLNTYNCTDFGIKFGNLGNLNLKDTSGTWPYKGNGSNPGNLGQDIRSMTLPSGVTSNATGGNSISNKGGC